MSKCFPICCALVIWHAVYCPVFACLWDNDTISMERRRFPQTLEMITGKFLRHSPQYYEWRIKDREARIKENPSSELYDDLAVAYEKVGNHENAISLTLEKQNLYPGLYPTHANLGTFYIHDGQFDQGLTELRKAISINPDAHFGREVYQQRLVQYLLSKRTDRTTSLPMSLQRRSEMTPTGFAAYLLETEGIGDSPAERKTLFTNAIKGVLGMMRFGNHDSPVLLEALGDLLLSDDFTSDGKQLAARAYLKACYESDDQATKDAYRTLAKDSLFNQVIGGETENGQIIQKLETTFATELEQANEWYSGVVNDELQWIAGGQNVDKAFAEKYYQDPEVEDTSTFPLKSVNRPSSRSALIITALGILIMSTVCVLSWFLVRRGRSSRDSSVG
jgi:tetratricopeptide (TPR) repeat protein